MRFLFLLVIAACGSSPKHDPTPAPAPAVAPEAPTSTKCLPLIGCGCFMQCSMGFFDEPDSGEWKVDYYDTMVMAKIEQQCVDGACAEVFAVHTCQDKCATAPPVKCELERGPTVTCKQRP
jgi:hypothetical protein